MSVYRCFAYLYTDKFFLESRRKFGYNEPTQAKEKKYAG